MFNMNQRGGNCRGQVMVFYALLIPLLFSFVGVGLDLGWYYLNVSRLQNAADAAVVAGAQALAKDFNSKANPSASTTTETMTSGNTTTITTTTATTTDTYTYKRLVDHYPANKPDNLPTKAGDDVARQYVIENLGEIREIQESDKTKNIIVDNWSKGGNPEVTPTYSLYKDDDENYYYVVTLTEKIQHLFMSGLFNDMDAPVVAVALISKGIDTDTFIENIKKALEDLKNKNVIIGNWEVQNYYREIAKQDGSETKVKVDDDGNPILDKTGKEQTVKLTRAEEYSNIYTTDYDKSIGIKREVYVSAWNMFQDYNVHFKSGKPIRYETIDIFDDVELVDPDLTGADKYTESNMQSYGKIGNGENHKTGNKEDPLVKNPSANGSSVQKTGAAGNGINKSSYTYNPDGNPYVWQDLDSIDVDFQPEVGWKTGSVYPLQDWDLKFGYDYWGNDHRDSSGDNSNVGVGAIKHNKYNNDGSEQSATEKGGWSDHLRIHSYINFKTPYPARSTDKTSSDDTDILWVRIESEPMFRYPDSKDPRKQTKNHRDIGGLNSVRQLIINFTESNIADNERPIVIFYDGPERYSTNNSIRDSQPIIVNLAAPVRAIIYAPNSPVVVIGDRQKDFQGFIVAKEFLRLKTTEDFEAELNLYEKTNDKGEVGKGDNYRTKATVDNPYFGTKHTKPDGTVVNYRDNGEPKKIQWMYKKIACSPTDTKGNVVGEFDMYVDDYGNVQYMELENQLTSIGKYAAFGRTEFSTHNYTLLKESASNMLISGVKFNYETGIDGDDDIRYKGTRVF